MDGRLTFPRKEKASYIRATRASSGQNFGRSIALPTFESHRPPPSSVFALSSPYNVNGSLAAAVLYPGGMFGSRNKRKKEADINHFHGFPLPVLIWVF